MLLTIFTPTYNRANLLSRLYNSLCLQTFQDFEWVIVDDGSQDDTENVIKKFIEESKIPIVYSKQENSGKHIAINKGVSLAKGELFFIVDSDDFLLPNAVEMVSNNYSNIQNVEVAGLSFRRGYDAQIPIGSSNFKTPFLMNVFEFRYGKKVVGDMAEVIKTDIMKKYTFPKLLNEKFLTEGLIWNRIGQKFKFLWLPEVIYIGEYLEGGLTDNNFSVRKKSPEGTLIFYSELQRMPINFFYKLRANINYWRFAKFSNRSFISKFKDVRFILSFFGLPLSLIFFIKDSK
ncbi:glycosyltransferase family 2 protein [Chryseobacterium sp. RG1]|uniref:Glycosyltransferase family 2 protein n=1 Tax=Chryseobacterium tagetis TaxID=2801334 RepID=A0ABS8A912_9FLAO|nr:glycosyltransferase family A protein [Chryseobacterium tagetis]MCA6069110.1 glycosyltransferase family 2 protein [Chryseobacterium tagetis]